MKHKKIKLFLIILAVSQNVYSLDVNITSISAESYMRFEYNKNFNFSGDISAAGELEIKNIYKIKSGISYGMLAGGTDLKFFVLTGASPFSKIPLDFSLLWIYNGIFEYNVHSNSVIPFVTYSGRIAGASMGYNFRFTNFYKDAVKPEATPVYSFFVNFINNDILCLGFIFRNFDEFKAGFLTEYLYCIFTGVRITENWQITSLIDILQSGGVTLAESFYGISFKTGVKYTW